MTRPTATRFRKVQVSMADLCAKVEHSPAVPWDAATVEALRARYARGAGSVTSTEWAVCEGAWTYCGVLQQVECLPVLGRIQVRTTPHGGNVSDFSWLVLA